MNKAVLLFLSYFTLAMQGIADQIVLENLTSHPHREDKTRIAVQWALSAGKVEKGNQAMIYGWELDRNTMQEVKGSGKAALNVPKQAQYFRILVWLKGEGSPDLLSSWVTIVPDKTYTLQEDHLFPVALMAGTGC